jgi:putative phosphoesterase
MNHILALSDTHQKEGISTELAKLAAKADIIIHAGDFVTTGVYDSFADIGRLEAVFGNSDSIELKNLLPERKIIEVEGVRIGIVHIASHLPDPTGPELLAREMEVDVLIFGHLHRPFLEKSEKLLVCPGSPTVPRMSLPTVALIEIDRGRVRGNILPLGGPTCDYIRYAHSLAQRE